MRVIVTGSRNWNRAVPIWYCLDTILKEAYAAGDFEVVVVHGCAQGADTHADLWARQRGHTWNVRAERHPADWRQGKGAGIARNARMVGLGADICLAFIRDNSRGATHCMEAAERAGIPVMLLDYAAATQDPPVPVGYGEGVA